MGNSQDFVLAFSDFDGVEDLSYLGMIFGPRVSAAHSCFLRYDVPTNTLYLMNDTAAWVGSRPLGSPGVLENSQCRIDTGAARGPYILDRVTLGLRIKVDLAPVYEYINVYSYAADKADLISDSPYPDPNPWKLQTTWFSLATTASVQPTNTFGGIAVRSGVRYGLGDTFTFQFSSYNGWADLSYVGVIIGPETAIKDVCFLRYDPLVNRLYLMNDGGTFWVGSDVLGTGGVLRNGRCSVDTAASSALGSGERLLLNLAISFDSNFYGYGRKRLYALATDSADRSTGWQFMDTYDVGLKFDGYSPTAYGEVNAILDDPQRVYAFHFTGRDVDGFRDVNFREVTIGSLSDRANSCVVNYSTASGSADYWVWLLDDTGQNWLGPRRLHQAGNYLGGVTLSPLANSQCSIVETTFRDRGEGFDTYLWLTFSNTFTGERNVYFLAGDRAGKSTGYQRVTTFNIW